MKERWNNPRDRSKGAEGRSSGAEDGKPQSKFQKSFTEVPEEEKYRDARQVGRTDPRRPRRDLDDRPERDADLRTEQQWRDIDARTEQGYVSVEDGKTTVYHYKDPAPTSRDPRDGPIKSKDRVLTRTSPGMMIPRVVERKRKFSETLKEPKPVKTEPKRERSEEMIPLKKERSPDSEKEEEVVKEKVGKKKKKEKKAKLNSSFSGTLLEKVNEILKSCSELKPVPSPAEQQQQKQQQQQGWSSNIKHEINLDSMEVSSIVEDKSLEDGEIHEDDSANEIGDDVYDDVDEKDKSKKRKVSFTTINDCSVFCDPHSSEVYIVYIYLPIIYIHI